ncbi:MAG: integrase core domain-containing protein [Corynebacterium sp.]|nr:integrase core domain-containing protein [Corynebacterium sp.]
MPAPIAIPPAGAGLDPKTLTEPVNHKRVARIVKAMNVKGFSKKRRCVTTKRTPDHQVMPDLISRNFTSSGPNNVYVGDITYLPCKGGKNMYLATVNDVYSRKLAGFALADHMRTSLVIEAYCQSLGVVQAMGAVGASADNALAESFHATLNPEVLKDRKVFDTPLTCRQKVFRWCTRYNTPRRHTWCHHPPPTCSKPSHQLQ